MTLNNSSLLISKEHIQYLQFSKTDTLKSKSNKNLRSHYLRRASQLGNLLKNKVHIYFKDSKNRFLHVYTTIWAVTTNFVVLKKGITIPKSSIVFVD